MRRPSEASIAARVPPVRHAIAALAAALALALGLRAARRSGAPATPATHTTVPDDPPDALRRYALDYRATETTRLADTDASALAEFTGALRLAAELVVSPARSPRGDTRLRALRLGAIERAELTMGGRPVLADLAEARRAFASTTVLVETGRDGAVRQVHYREGDPIVARLVLRQLALDTAVVRRPGASWEAAEPTPAGTALSRYAWRAGTAVLTRDRGAYARFSNPATGPAAVRGAWTFTWRADGSLDALEGEERIAVGAAARPSLARETAITLRLLASAPAQPLVDLGGFAPRAPDRPPVSDALAAQHAAQRVGDLTVDAMLSALEEALETGAVPDATRFFWRATALLARDDGAVRALVPLFNSARAGERMRGYLLDLLARTGTPASQRALVALLDGAAAQGSARPHYLQRLGFVADPEPATLRAAERAMDDPATRGAAPYVLGSLARRLDESGRGEDARALNARLREALERAGPADRAHVIAGLGNARREDNGPALARVAGDPDARVRLALAAALARTPGGPSRAALWALTRDGELAVQARALESLGEATLTAAQVDDLAARVRDGSLPQGAYGALLALLRAQAAAHPAAARQCLDAMIAQDIVDPQVRAATYALRDGLRS